MTIAIGRAGRDADIPLNSPSYWSQNGVIVDTGGALTATSYAHLVLLRAQVAGLADNPAEPVVGVSWPGDASVDGFYEVISAAVDMPARGLAARKLNWKVRLRRVAVYPDINSLTVGDAVRTNAHSIGKGDTVPWWALPDAATMDYIPGASTATRAAETGDVKVQYSTGGLIMFNRTNRWQCPAADYYDGAARIELFDGVGWYAAVGDRLPNTLPTYGWRINNGLVRVSYGVGDGLLKVEHYISGAWSVSKTYKVTVTTTPSTIGAFRTFTPVWNSPEVVTVRLGLDQANASIPAAVTIDLTLRRGALWVEGVTSRTSEIVSYLGSELGLYRNTAEAATAVTSGIRATSADAQGGKFWMCTSLGKTNDLTQGGFYVSSAVNEFDWAVGYEPPSAAGPDTFTNQIYGYFGPLDETVGFARR